MNGGKAMNTEASTPKRIVVSSEKLLERINASTIAVVLFFRHQTGASRQMIRVMHAIKNEREDVDVIALEVSENSEFVRVWRISSTPCFIIYRNGRCIGRGKGIVPKADVVHRLNKPVPARTRGPATQHEAAK